MPASVTKEEAAEHFKMFFELLKRPEDNTDEYWFANWWMGKYVTEQQFDKLVHRGITDDNFCSELFDHYRDWLKQLSEEDFQNHLDRLNNLVLF